MVCVLSIHFYLKNLFTYVLACAACITYRVLTAGFRILRKAV